MAWTNVGFDGTINEAQWSQMSTLMGSSGGGYLAAGNGDCLVTAVPGARSVSVAAGSLYGDGVVSTNSAPETVAMTTPVNGQWYVIALRRTWATNTAALVAIAGATTTTTTPTAPPTSFPTLNTNQGVLTDQPIAWAWCNSANTTVVVYDIRLKGIKSTPPVVANANERDAKFMTPSQGLQVWRDDLGAVETYFGLYNASTNPGGRDSAGWYSNDRAGGLVPVRPISVTIASGSGSVNSLGVVSFTSATSVSLDNIFTTEYNNYKMILKTTSVSTTMEFWTRLRSSGTDASGSNYFRGGSYTLTNGSLTQTSTNGSNVFFLGGSANGVGASTTIAEIQSPRLSEETLIHSTHYGFFSGWGAAFIQTGKHNLSNAYDGFTLIASGGTMTGNIQIFGYND